MNKVGIFLTLSGYQATWLACVFGENKFNQPLLGVYVGVLYLLLYFYFNKKKFNLLITCLSISIPGYLFDTLLVYSSIYNFNSSVIFGTIPIWMIILWLSFSTLFDEILIFFKKRKFIGVILSGVLGPITYYIGEPIGIISINNIVLFFILMVFFWVILMIYYLNIILKRK